MLYDLLAANVPKSQQHQYHAANDFAKRFPVLDTTGLKGGFTYLDAQTDDARLVSRINKRSPVRRRDLSELLSSYRFIAKP